MRGGQGLPLNVIVLAVVAILTLTLIILFATGSLGKLFKSTKTLEETVTPDQVATFRIGCEQSCFSARQFVNTQSEWTNSAYCNRMVGTFDCLSPEVGVDCEFEVTEPGGNIITYNNSCCGGGCT